MNVWRRMKKRILNDEENGKINNVWIIKCCER
jgi:hypothetical protein